MTPLLAIFCLIVMGVLSFFTGQFLLTIICFGSLIFVIYFSAGKFLWSIFAEVYVIFFAIIDAIIAAVSGLVMFVLETFL